jgi:hypothetical protein
MTSLRGKTNAPVPVWLSNSYRVHRLAMGPFLNEPAHRGSARPAYLSLCREVPVPVSVSIAACTCCQCRPPVSGRDRRAW